MDGSVTIWDIYVHTMGAFLLAGALAFLLAWLMGLITMFVEALFGRVAAMVVSTAAMLCAVGVFLVLVEWMLTFVGTRT